MQYSLLTDPYSVFCISGSALLPAVILSGAGGKIAFSDLVERSPSAMNQTLLKKKAFPLVGKVGNSLCELVG